MGLVKEILFSGNHFKSKFSAKLIIDGEYHLVDYDYLFKLNDLKIDINEHKVIIGNPTILYVFRYELMSISGIIDKYYQFTMIGKTSENTYKTFLMSGLC